jgi:hypothetical protein
MGEGTRAWSSGNWAREPGHGKAEHWAREPGHGKRDAPLQRELLARVINNFQRSRVPLFKTPLSHFINTFTFVKAENWAREPGNRPRWSSTRRTQPSRGSQRAWMRRWRTTRLVALLGRVSSWHRLQRYTAGKRHPLASFATTRIERPIHTTDQ